MTKAMKFLRGRMSMREIENRARWIYASHSISCTIKLESTIWKGYRGGWKACWNLVVDSPVHHLCPSACYSFCSSDDARFRCDVADSTGRFFCRSQWVHSCVIISLSKDTKCSNYSICILISSCTNACSTSLSPFINKLHCSHALSCFILLLFILLILYTWMTFPFSSVAPLRVFFQQCVQIDLGLNILHSNGNNMASDMRYVHEKLDRIWLPGSYRVSRSFNQTSL